MNYRATNTKGHTTYARTIEELERYIGRNKKDIVDITTRNLDSLIGYANVRKLTAILSDVNTFTSIGELSCLEELTMLYGNVLDINSIMEKSFATRFHISDIQGNINDLVFPERTEQIVINSHLKINDWTMFQRLPNLRVLGVHGVNVDQPKVMTSHVFQRLGIRTSYSLEGINLEHITHLVVRGQGRDTFSVSNIESAKSLTNLVMTNIDSLDLACIGALKNLEYLRISCCNKVTGAEHLARCTSIKGLKIYCTNMEVGFCSQLPSLRTYTCQLNNTTRCVESTTKSMPVAYFVTNKELFLALGDSNIYEEIDNDLSAKEEHYNK